MYSGLLVIWYCYLTGVIVDILSRTKDELEDIVSDFINLKNTISLTAAFKYLAINILVKLLYSVFWPIVIVADLCAKVEKILTKK